MSKYSINVNGKVLDFGYKKRINNAYLFYIGDILIGQVINSGRYWSCFSQKPYKLGVVDGFKTRQNACSFLLQLNGYYDKVEETEVGGL